MKETKIGYWETYNKDSGMIEKSSGRRNQTTALWVGLILAIIGVMPWIDVKFGDVFPMVIVLLAYSLGASAWQKATEVLGSVKSFNKPSDLKE
jgi:hypothetical protein